MSLFFYIKINNAEEKLLDENKVKFEDNKIKHIDEDNNDKEDNFNDNNDEDEIDEIEIIEDEFLREDMNKRRLMVKRTFQKNKLKTCPINVNRDYNKNPCKLGERNSDTAKYWMSLCPVKSIVSTKNPDVTKYSKQPCSYSYKFTMENRGKGSGLDLFGNTKLNTDVPTPYFGWFDYPFHEPLGENKYEMLTGIDKGTGKKRAMMAAFVSNCGPQKRLNILKELMKYNVTIDSYGRCLHNKNMPNEVKRKGQQPSKKITTKKYMFTYSAENSETNDYVTEKFFLPLVVGSIPVYYGAPNIKRFAPSEKSFLHINDFKGDIKALAKTIINIYNNKKEFESYFKWKKEGPSKNFISVMDTTIHHSFCRWCLVSSDIRRIEYNNTVGHEQLDVNLIKSGEYRYFKVRERNSFYLSYVYVKKKVFSVVRLKKEILKKRKIKDIYKLYFLWDRNKIPIYEKDINLLKDNDELEYISITENNDNRFEFSKWQRDNNVLYGGD